MPNVIYVWEQTPKEWFTCIRPVPSHRTADTVTVEATPFVCAKKRLLGTNFFYQLALSESSLAEDVRAIRQACPTLPLSGDTRSGVLIFDGNKIIASYLFPGTYTRNERRLAVHPDYRGQGLAKLMVSQWQREVPTVDTIPPQTVNVAAVRTMFSAIKMTLAWAVSSGKVVPQRVRDAWSAGTEEAEILAELLKVEQASGSPRQRVANRFAR